VLGELQMSVLLRKQWGNRAAAGWDGDRYAVFAGPKEDLGLVWYTTWDSESDAKEFASAYWRYLGVKIGISEARSGSNEPSPPEIADRVNITHSGRSYCVLRHAADVIVIEGFTDQLTESLAAAVLKSEKHIKK
jgi:hypothetical protein